MNLFFNEKMHVTFMNSVAYNWSLGSWIFLFLWIIMEFVAVSGWNSSGKHVNSQLKVNGIGIAKFQPRNIVSWLHFGGRLVEIRGYIYSLEGIDWSLTHMLPHTQFISRDRVSGLERCYLAWGTFPTGNLILRPRI